MFKMKYPILPDFIEGVPQIPYRLGAGKYEGVVCHETAGYASAVNEIMYERRNWKNAFVHYFVDPSGIRQCADHNYIAYGAGHPANQRYVHVELCRTRESDSFKRSYDRYTWLLAYLLFRGGQQVVDCVTLLSHDWVSRNLGGTDHADPIAYLASWGISWTEHVEYVKRAYLENQQEDEDQMKLEQEWQWKMLGDSLDGLYRKGAITDYTWAEKAYKRELSHSELAWLNTIILARQHGVEI